MNICEKHGPSPRAKDPAARASNRDFGAKTVVFDPISGGPGRIAGDRGPWSGVQRRGF